MTTLAMSAADAVRALLAADTTVAGLVGGRIYLEQAPDEADLPLLVYDVTLGQQEAQTAPLWPCTVDVHCYAATDSATQSLAVAVDGVLRDANAVSGGTWVRQLNLDSWDDDRDVSLNEWGRRLSYAGHVMRAS